jgi:cyclopropane fatty-acyl-phospholipid synthase-like methyltransferase
MQNQTVLITKGGFLQDTYRTAGIMGCARKILAALRMKLPLWALGRRTNASVAAYFDLITDDARMFYNDCFHFGYFKEGGEDFEQALANHTDAVAEFAGVAAGARVLDVGCGIAAPAIRIARQHACHITGINISAEQVRQGQDLVEQHGLSDRITVQSGNALDLPFSDASFDAALCIEVAGDICVTDVQKTQLARELHRVLAPGGRIGFSDLVFTAAPTRDEERVLRSVLYHEGAELVTDWPKVFERCGFTVTRRTDIIRETMQTWDHSLAIYEARADEVEQRYGRAIARRVMADLKRIPVILEKYGSFLLMSMEKPA